MKKTVFYDLPQFYFGADLLKRVSLEARRSVLKMTGIAYLST